MNDGSPTRRNSDSVIDLFLVTPKVIPEIAGCETLTGESVRSDHIGVLMEVYRTNQPTETSVEKYLISKTDWEKWSEVTEDRFKAWNSTVEANAGGDVEDMAVSFLEVYAECVEDCVPKRMVKMESRRRKPPWWNEEVTSSKQNLNKAKKSFKRRSTPQNLENIRNCESKHEEAQELAKATWTEEVCTKITRAGSTKEMWQNFHTLTSYENYSHNGVLPLKNGSNRAVFDDREKCDVLGKAFFSGSHLSGCMFEDDWKRKVEDDIGSIKAGSMQADKDAEELANEYLNHDISEGEVLATIQHLKKNKAPGPDGVYTEMLQHAGPELMKAITRLLQMSWEEGVVPAIWKEAEVKFLRKSGKKSYHEPSAYRPISLTSYLCKCLERIITHRLYGFAEHRKLLDEEQEGFRKFRGTTEALLRFTQDVYNGFNIREHTAAVFVDVEKAYDSVWREGLLYKLWKMGVNGRIWWWVEDFLSNRTVAINLNGVHAPKVESEVGLPQGSVISPLLFSLYIADWYNTTTCQKVKFADDGTLWRTGSDWKKLVQDLQEDFRGVAQWARKWRLKLSLPKTEFCVFSTSSQVLEEARTLDFTVDGQPIKYNPNPKLLGVHLDERLRFAHHTGIVEKKAMWTVERIRKVKLTEHINTDCLLKLYRALVIPQLEYAASVWQCGNCEALDRVQRKALAMCLGIPGTAGIDAMQVEADVMPLEIRREEVCIRQAARIVMKQDDTLIKRAWNAFQDSQVKEHFISPFGKMSVQVADLISNTGIPIERLERQFSYNDSLQPSRSPPEYWRALGSSSSRSAEQCSMSRRVVEEQLQSIDLETIVAFTDGSCQGNPGPCGAGACLFMPGQDEPVLLKQAVTSHGTILLGELVAIQMVLRYVLSTCSSGAVHIFSDSQSAIGNLSLGWKSQSHKSTIHEIQGMLHSLANANIKVDLSWTPGHAEIQGNEIADKVAKEAAKEARDKGEQDLPAVITLGEVKTAARKYGTAKWQERWDASETGRTLFHHRPSVGFKAKHTFISPRMEQVVVQLRTGYARLGEYLQKVGVVEDGLCGNCGSLETIHHFLLECPGYTEHREKMRQGLQRMCGIVHLDSNVLLDMRPDDEYKEFRSTILFLLEEYVAATERFATC